MIKHVHIIESTHHLSNHTVAIVVHQWKVFRACLTVKTAWVHDFDVAVVLVETCRHIGLIISMHAGVHTEFVKCLERIVHNFLFAQHTDRYWATGYDAITNEIVEKWQSFIEATLKSSFI